MPTNVLDIIVEERKSRILYIGNADSTPGIFYLEGLVTSGYEVVHVGIGSKSFDIRNLPEKPYILENEAGRATVFIKEFSLKSLLDMVGYDFAAIVHVQNWLYFSDREYSPIPYFYYCTEVSYPRIPRCAWFVLSATDVLKRMNMRDATWIKSFIYHPHCLRVSAGDNVVFPPFKKTIKGSFAGEVYRLPLYTQRREIVKYVQEHVKDFEAHYVGPLVEFGKERPAEAGDGHLNAQKYTNLLLKSRCILNVPTIGGANFRDIEALAAGCMLVTMQTPDLYYMGLEDGINCRIYNTKEEATEILNAGWDEGIARKGWELIMFGRTWYQQKTFDKSLLLRFRGTKKDGDKSYLEFWIADGFNINKELAALKKDSNLIKNYEREKNILKVYHLEDSYIEFILNELGFQQWHISGHTVEHRMKELASFMKHAIGLPIPIEIEERLERFTKKREEPEEPKKPDIIKEISK